MTPADKCRFHRAKQFTLVQHSQRATAQPSRLVAGQPDAADRGRTDVCAGELRRNRFDGYRCTLTRWIPFANGLATEQACDYPSPVASKPAGARDMTQGNPQRSPATPTTPLVNPALRCWVILGAERDRATASTARLAGAMRSSDEVSTVSSSLLNVGTVPLEQMPALPAAVLDPIVQRAAPVSPLALSPSMGFSSSI